MLKNAILTACILTFPLGGQAQSSTDSVRVEITRVVQFVQLVQQLEGIGRGDVRKIACFDGDAVLRSQTVPET